MQSPLLETKQASEPWSTFVLLLVVDMAASAAFCYFVVHSGKMSWCDWGVVCACVSVFMILWRSWRVRYQSADLEGLPYTCGVATADGCQLFLVATVHISPKSPLDVEVVMNKTNPDLVMIELDEEEHLDRARQQRAIGAIEGGQGPPIEDLQPISLWMHGRNGPPIVVHAQRAYWNAEQTGNTIIGDVLFNPANMYGLCAFGTEAQDRLCLVYRGAGDTGLFAPFFGKVSQCSGRWGQSIVGH